MRNLSLFLFSLLIAAIFASVAPGGDVAVDHNVIAVPITPPTAPAQATSGGSSGSGGSTAGSGDVYFNIAQSGECANQPLLITLTSSGRPVPGADVKFYLDTGPLNLTDEQTTSSSGTASFHPVQAGKYQIIAATDSMQKTSVAYIQDCAPANLVPPSPSAGNIQLAGVPSILMQKRLDWNSGFSKEITVTRTGTDVSSRIVLTYSPPNGQVAPGYEIVDTIPASIASGFSLVQLQSPATKISEFPMTFSFAPALAGKTTVSYVIGREITDDMLSSLPEPKLQKSVAVQSNVTSGGPGIGSSILASATGFFTGNDIGIILGVLLGGLIMVFIIYMLAFRREPQKE